MKRLLEDESVKGPEGAGAEQGGEKAESLGLEVVVESGESGQAAAGKEGLGAVTSPTSSVARRKKKEKLLKTRKVRGRGCDVVWTV